MDHPQVHLEPWDGPIPPGDPHANFKAEVARYSPLDPTGTLRGLEATVGIPAGALARYVLARWASAGSDALLEIGPPMVEALWAVCATAGRAGTDDARLAAFRELDERISWLHAALHQDTVSPAPRSVYVASPLGFTEPGRHYSATVLHPRLVAEGFSVLDPWDDEDGAVAAALATPPGPQRGAALTAMSAAVGARNRRLLGSAGAVLAVLDGSDVDSGTAAEVGWAAGRGLPVVGWRSDFRLAEHEASRVNIQVEDFVAASGGRMVTTLDEAVAALGALLR